MKRTRLFTALLILALLAGIMAAFAPQVMAEAKSSYITSLKDVKVNEGKTKKLTLKVSKDNGLTWISGSKLKKEFGKITWKSSDKSIATVSNKGKVKGISCGSVKITAKTKKGGITASCYVTVRETPAKYDKSGPKKLTLSGKTEDHVITDSYCYVEGDKFVLLVEPDIDLPGDFAKNIGLIMDTLEEMVGLTYDGWENPRTFDYKNEFLASADPWEGVSFGMKVPIYIRVDRKDAGYIPSANEQYVTIFDYALFSMDFWNSVPSYRDNAWRRGSGHVSYYTLAHELTHTLTDRYTYVSRTTTEGSATYFGYEVIKTLAKDNAEFAKSLEETWLDTEVGIEITAENAEAVFLDDFSTLSHADRGAEYVLGQYFCEYLAESYGPYFMRDYLLEVKKSGFDGLYGVYTDKDKQQLVDCYKKVFGKKVFEKFGKWYVKNK